MSAQPKTNNMRKLYKKLSKTGSSIFAIVLMLTVTSCNKPRYDVIGGIQKESLPAKQRKVLIIGISGVRSDVLLKTNTPNISKLLPHSIYSFDALTEAPTLEEPGWSSMLTGVWSAKHGVISSSYNGNQFSKYPMLFKHIKEFNPNLKTISISAATALNTTLVTNADTKESFENDDVAVKNKTITSLKDASSDVVLADFKGVDLAGDQYGFDLSIPQYVQAITTADSYIGELVAAVNSRPTIENEDWLIIVSTDHGGTLTGHGGNEYESRNIFTIFYNKNFSSTNIAKSETNTTFLKINQTEGLQYAFSNSSLYKMDKYPKFTFEMRVKIDGSLASDPSFASNKDWDSGRNPGWGIFASGQKWKFNAGDGTSAGRKDINPLNVTPPISDGKWHHIAVSVNKSGFARTYQDGIFLQQLNVAGLTTWDNNLPATLAILEDGTLNTRNAYGYRIKVNFADVRLWSAEVDSTTIKTYAKCDTTVTPDHPYYENLIGWWKGNDAKGSILKDYSLRNSNLTIFGTPKWEETGKNLCNDVIQSDVPKTVDIAAQVYSWLRIPINPDWHLDGKVWLSN